jgi:hypothetical protein
MTVTEAKELLIDGMNYAAYKETDHSLWATDKDRLFGEPHYHEDSPAFSPSVWGDGEEFETKMAQLLKWALQLGSAKGDYREAIRTLRGGDHYLNRIVERAGLANV